MIVVFCCREVVGLLRCRLSVREEGAVCLYTFCVLLFSIPVMVVIIMYEVDTAEVLYCFLSRNLFRKVYRIVSRDLCSYERAKEPEGSNNVPDS